MSLYTFKNGQTSNVLRIKIADSTKTNNGGLTGLTSASTGLIISSICDNETTAVAYTVAGSTIQTITTLGTFAAPSASNCRFKEVDSTNHPGLYELQLADARFSVSNAKRITVTLSGATNMVQTDFVICLFSVDPYDAVHGGLSALPNTACTGNASLITSGTGTDQLSIASGVAKANLTQILGTVLTETAGQIAAAFKWFFNIASPTGTVNSLPNAIAGATGGILIAGANAATTFATLTITGALSINGVSNVSQTGDSYSKLPINFNLLTINGSGFVTFSNSGVGTAANQTTIINAVNGITTNTARSAPRVPDFLARPTSGSVIYTGDLYLYTLQGNLEDADSSTITIHARNAAGTSLDAGLSSTTMTRISIGFYRLTYTVNSTDTAQAVYFDFSWLISSTAMRDGAATEVQDAENYSTLAAVKAKTDNLPSDPASESNATTNKNTIVAAIPSTSANATAIWASGTRVLTAGTNIVLAKGVGITGLNDIAAGAQMDLINSPNSTAIANINQATATALTTIGANVLLIPTSPALAGSAPSWYSAPPSVAALATTTQLSAVQTAIIAHGDANWESGGGGGGFVGTESVTLIFNDSRGDGFPVASVTFKILSVGGAGTDGSGAFTGGMNPGTYTMLATAQNGVMWSEQTFEVTSASTQTIQFTGTTIPAPPTPVTPDGCVISFIAENQDGSFPVGRVFNFILITPRAGTGYAYVTSNNIPRTAVVQSDGTVNVELPQGDTWQMSLPNSGLSTQIQVPMASNLQLQNVRV